MKSQSKEPRRGIGTGDHPALSADQLAEIAHELRTPLGGIEAMAAIIAAGELSRAQRQAADALLASVAHLREVASTLLEGHRERKTGRGAPRRETGGLRLRSLLDHVATAARSRAVSQHVDFTLRIAESVPETIAVSGTHLRQMIENLLDNALKVTHSGSVSLNVDRIGRRGALHELRFAVRDSGPGFTQAQAECLFQPFNRLDEAVPGTGIGLSLVRRLAQGLGGDAGADGEPGAGAIVWFTIVVEGEEPANIERELPPLHTKLPKINEERPPMVLVVDDNLASRMVMAVMLEQFGCEVRLACSGAEAIETLRRDQFDAVMMDMTMSGLDGSETTRRIRAMSVPHADIPVIAVTGRVGDADRARFREAGANAFVPKPVLPRAVWLSLRDAGVVADNDGGARFVA